ncbi:MAG: hypothetical protein NTZ55_02140 [Candidatus Roizmanbacteria bacterium]|nr:hypothetical protein [Candidatus Roizmanbacteria bacterium]
MMEIRHGCSELLSIPKGPHTHIHFGDATLLPSLRTLALGKRAIAIDNNPEATRMIMHELESGLPVFSFLNHSIAQSQTYASIELKVLQDKSRAEQLQRVYREAWEQAKNNLHLLTCIDADIKSIPTSTLMPVAEKITYLYPSPRYDPRFATLELASCLLKRDGIFTIVTENEEVAQDFSQLAGPFITHSGFKRREKNEEPLSAYDIAWGQEGHYLVEIKNKGGKLPSHIKEVKNSLTFKALSFLGMVQ